MKTTVKVQETANRKFKRVMVKVFTSVIVLVLTSFTVHSQTLWEPIPQTVAINTIHLTADAVDENGALLSAAATSFNSHSSTKFPAFSTFKIDPATEEMLAIEPWMTDSRNFEQSISLEVEKESPLKLEEWMTNELNFGTSTLPFAPGMEKPMEVESWMTDEYFWENEGE